MSNRADEPRIERSYHPNGRIAAEVTYVGDHVEGIMKHWHDNGVLKREIPALRAVIHGKVRAWDRAGNLLDESEFVDGTGIDRSFHDNGTLAGELCMKNSIPHGYQRCWDESGELYAEVFYVNGRKVSRKRYEQACKEDPDLPVPPTGSVAGPVWPEAVETGPDVAIQRGEKELERLLAAGPHAEALAWLKNSNAILGEGLVEDEAIEFINQFYKAGAEQVIAIEIDKDSDGEENTGKLVVKLPSAPDRRGKVLRICNKLNKQLGFKADRDVGQQFILVMLD